MQRRNEPQRTRTADKTLRPVVADGMDSARHNRRQTESARRHGGCHKGYVERDVAREAGVEFNLVGGHLRKGRHEEHVVERDALLGDFIFYK